MCLWPGSIRNLTARYARTRCYHILLTFASQLKDPKDVLAHADVDGNTALHFASSNGHLLVLRTLLAAGADSERRNVWMWTPVAYSATVQAEVYFKGLVSEIDRRRTASGKGSVNSGAGRASLEKRGGGVRIVTSGDD
ncbi:hypothetical protein ACMFMF_005598 [Clarireedia jacksonii]